ncbi:hypothetical protein C8039_10570 [Halogeometricum sp. wsp3]|nr:hypothetical protein C8039_10570 [Halogeometricum sp. wsp3]
MPGTTSGVRLHGDVGPTANVSYRLQRWVTRSVTGRGHDVHLSLAAMSGDIIHAISTLGVRLENLQV